MPNPKKEPSKRRGKAVKPKKGEPAEFQAGGAAAPKNFDPAAVAESLNIWWEAEGGDSFWVGDAQGWAKWPKDALLDLCLASKHSVAKKRREGEFMAETSRLLVHIRQHRRVDGVMWGLAGYPSGLHRMPSGEVLIVRTSPAPVVPQQGDWSLVRELIEGRLDLGLDVPKSDNDGDEPRPTHDQVLYWHAIHKTVLNSLLHGKPGSWTQRQFLVLAGPVGCGKSRLQVMVTDGLLGGRVANPKDFLTGKESFNSDLVKAEHLKMEELDNVSQKTVDRLAFGESIKAVVANTGVKMRLMRTDPLTITPFWFATLSMNNDPDKLRSFPPLTPDFREKVTMLLVRKAPLPMPTRSDDDKEAFNRAVREQLPAYAHWLLNEFQIPDRLLVDDNGADASRYGCRSWQHPTLAMELMDDTPSAELLAMIDAAEFRAGEKSQSYKLWDLKSHAAADGVWEGSAMDLEKLLLGEVPGDDGWICSVAREAKKLVMHNKIERLLGRLKEDAPLRVAPHRTKLERRWVVTKPE